METKPQLDSSLLCCNSYTLLSKMIQKPTLNRKTSEITQLICFDINICIKNIIKNQIKTPFEEERERLTEHRAKRRAIRMTWKPTIFWSFTVTPERNGTRVGLGLNFSDSASVKALLNPQLFIGRFGRVRNYEKLVCPFHFFFVVRWRDVPHILWSFYFYFVKK